MSAALVKLLAAVQRYRFAFSSGSLAAGVRFGLGVMPYWNSFKWFPVFSVGGDWCWVIELPYDFIIPGGGLPNVANVSCESTFPGGMFTQYPYPIILVECNPPLPSTKVTVQLQPNSYVSQVIYFGRFEPEFCSRPVCCELKLLQGEFHYSFSSRHHSALLAREPAICMFSSRARRMYAM